MGLGKRVFSGNRRAILAEDSAISSTTRQWLEYARHGCDESFLSFVEGEEPSYFTIRPLTPKQKSHVASMSITSPEAVNDEYVRLGLVSCDAYEVWTDNGVQALPAMQRQMVGKLCPDALTDKWLEDANFPGEHLASLAIAIKGISEATAPLSRRSESQSGASDGPSKEPARTAA